MYSQVAPVMSYALNIHLNVINKQSLVSAVTLLWTCNTVHPGNFYVDYATQNMAAGPVCRNSMPSQDNALQVHTNLWKNGASHAFASLIKTMLAMK
jgi:hypothetical protein